MSVFQALVITISLSSLIVAVIELSKKVNRP
ncbi:putative holin-like toxin [Cytobacillus praedii]|nr:putative holin-like toxin [Cytobacillus praedii]